MANLLLYLVLAALAVALAPGALRGIFACVALLPMPLQLAGSLSPDAAVLGVVFLFTACCMALRRQRGRPVADPAAGGAGGGGGPCQSRLSAGHPALPAGPGGSSGPAAGPRGPLRAAVCGQPCTGASGAGRHPAAGGPALGGLQRTGAGLRRARHEHGPAGRGLRGGSPAPGAGGGSLPAAAEQPEGAARLPPGGCGFSLPWRQPAAFTP